MEAQQLQMRWRATHPQDKESPEVLFVYSDGG